MEHVLLSVERMRSDVFTALDDLSSRVSRLETAQNAEMAKPVDLTPLESRLAAAEHRESNRAKYLETVAASLTELQESVADIDAKVDTIDIATVSCGDRFNPDSVVGKLFAGNLADLRFFGI